MPAGIAAGHPATAEVGLRMLAMGGTAADAAVAATLASCVAESVLTGIGGGGFATYYEAASGQVTCLDFFCSVPGLDGDAAPGPMLPIEVNFGLVPMTYAIGGASVGVPGVPAGCGEVHRRWGRLPWHQVVEPAITLARSGVVLPAAQASTLAAIAPALLVGAGAASYAPGGRLLRGGDLLYHPGLDAALGTLADEGPAVFYTGRIADLTVAAVRGTGGALGPADLAAYRVLEVPVHGAPLAGRLVCGRADLNGTIATIAALPPALAELPLPARTVAVAEALRDQGRRHGPGGWQGRGETTNISVVDWAGNACVVTTTLGIGSAVWLPGLGVNLNSMLGEGELITPELAPGRRMQSMMCPLVVVDPSRPAGTGAGPAGTGRADSAGREGAASQAGAAGGARPGRSGLDHLVVAAGSAGASRIRTALLDTLIGILIDGLDLPAAIARPRFHVIDGAVHAEPDYPVEGLAALSAAGYPVTRWDHLSHYFGGVSAVGCAGAAGDPRRGGIGILALPPPPR